MSYNTDTWGNREEELIQLAYINESESYTIDQALIGYDSKTHKFVLMTATGCSCWEGQYDEESYESLQELEKALITKDRTYNPSLKGAESLIQEAYDTWDNIDTFKTIGE